ncbi:MAG: hypothetical protein KBI44_16485 [Thermoanaerobaculia bacterium]|nr:hypothetical protein [Thermoanaerobaculia bacterium]
MTRGEIDPQLAEALEELRIVGLEQDVQVHPSRVRPPLQEQVEEVSTPQPQGLVEGTLRLQREVVPVRDEEQDQGVILPIQSDL